MNSDQIANRFFDRSSQVFIHACNSNRFTHDVFRRVQCTCVLAHFTHVFHCLVWLNDETPNQAHVETQLCAMDYWKANIHARQEVDEPVANFLLVHIVTFIYNICPDLYW